MQKICRKSGRTRYILAVLMTGAVLMGCSPALAGTSVNTGAAEVMAQTQGHVTWFDGVQIREADVNLTGLTDLDTLPFSPDLSLIPLAETNQLKCIKITSTDDIDGLYDMQLLGMNQEPIFHVRTLYDGGMYPLGNNWYGVILPNGYAEHSLLRIGNTYFEVQ